MSNVKVKVQPWAEAEALSEATIHQIMNGEGLRPYAWANGPGDLYTPHTHAYHKVIYVVRGSITFGLPDEGEAVTLKAGDRMDLPPGILHDAEVGPQGVLCLEGHRFV